MGQRGDTEWVLRGPSAARFEAPSRGLNTADRQKLGKGLTVRDILECMAALAQYHRWSDIPVEQLTPTLTRQFVSGSQTTLSTIALQRGAQVSAHAHPNEQIAYVVSGALRFVLDPDGEPAVFIVRGGELLIIPPNVAHSAEALEDTLNLDFFAPARVDWAAGDDAYLRSGGAEEKA